VQQQHQQHVQQQQPHLPVFEPVVLPSFDEFSRAVSFPNYLPSMPQAPPQQASVSEVSSRSVSNRLLTLSTTEMANVKEKGQNERQECKQGKQKKHEADALRALVSLADTMASR
jgi:hypothetical protein